MKRTLVFLLLIVAIIVLVGSVQPVMAQPPGGGGNPCPFPPCNPDVPISGIEFLIAGGAMYGMRRIMSTWKKDK